MKFLFIILFQTYFIFANDGIENKNVEFTPNSKVEMYTALFWAPCKEAKVLLQSRGIEFETHLITLSRKNVKEMSKRTNGKTFVPQILVDNKYFGGLAELNSYFRNKPTTD